MRVSPAGWYFRHDQFGYDTSTSVEELRKTYEYNETCQRTVAEEFRCFVEAEDFEDAIRNAISIGGDSDAGGDYGEYCRGEVGCADGDSAGGAKANG